MSKRHGLSDSSVALIEASFPLREPSARRPSTRFDTLLSLDIIACGNREDVATKLTDGAIDNGVPNANVMKKL